MTLLARVYRPCFLDSALLVRRDVLCLHWQNLKKISTEFQRAGSNLPFSSVDTARIWPIIHDPTGDLSLRKPIAKYVVIESFFG